MTNINKNKDIYQIGSCPKCNSKKIDIIDLDEYNEILIFKCFECKEEFTKPIEVIVSAINHTQPTLPHLA